MDRTAIAALKAIEAKVPSLSKIPAAARKVTVDEAEVNSESAYVIAYGESKLFLKGSDITEAWRDVDDESEDVAKYWKFNPKDKTFKGGPWPISKKALIRVYDNMLSLGFIPAKPTLSAVSIGR